MLQAGRIITWGQVFIAFAAEFGEDGTRFVRGRAVGHHESGDHAAAAHAHHAQGHHAQATHHMEQAAPAHATHPSTKK